MQFAIVFTSKVERQRSAVEFMLPPDDRTRLFNVLSRLSGGEVLANGLVRQAIELFFKSRPRL